MAVYENFRFDEREYNARVVREEHYHSNREYRKEYQRLYAVAKKRLKAFERAGETDNKRYRYYNRTIQPSSKLNDRELSYALQDVYSMLTDPRASVSGLREYQRKIVEDFHDDGWNFITMKNLKLFGDFMDARRAADDDIIYGSERVGELFGTAVKKGIEISELEKEFEFFMENHKILKTLPKHRDPKARTAEAYRKEIEKAKKRKRKR